VTTSLPGSSAIDLVPVHRHQPFKDYVGRRIAQGKTKTEIRRYRKRYVASKVHPCLLTAPLSSGRLHSSTQVS